MTTPDSKHILFADDDVKLRTMLGLMLAGEGYKVSHALTGKEAIALHRHEPFDLIITELGLEGFEALMKLRRRPSPAKFIATANSSRVPSELCLRIGEQLGAHCVLIKPFTPEQLLAAVRSALD
jgi:two-component system response regulator MtrA